uniref:Uncharacterized protein n=1 Tax=Myoviridae sp. ctMne5 TaxID=2825089 RepID=A0A8S5TZU3_9CAUD|nr:MAG TPA: hypothetical protein [Myoviridae sp. ctMne5]DAK05867.1 MAG TPA: hypothetical protein [Caudoviricetes sp.]
MCNKISFDLTYYIPMQHKMQHENYMKMIQYFKNKVSEFKLR